MQHHSWISISVVRPGLPCLGKHKSTAQFETKMQDQTAHRIRTKNLTPRCNRRRCVRATNMYFSYDITNMNHKNGVSWKVDSARHKVSFVRTECPRNGRYPLEHGFSIPSGTATKRPWKIHRSLGGIVGHTSQHILGHIFGNVSGTLQKTFLNSWIDKVQDKWRLQSEWGKLIC